MKRSTPSFAVVSAISVFGLTDPFQYIWFAFLGAALAGGVVFGLSSIGRGAGNPLTLALAGQATASLETHTSLGAAEDGWRLVLAYNVGRAGLPDLTARLLAPLLSSTDHARQDAARRVGDRDGQRAGVEGNPSG